MTGLYTPNSIRTYTGCYFNISTMNPDSILIEDIAHALSMQCRFAAHLPRFYSVAQHSVHCFERASKENKKAALLHDASEAYMNDMPSPYKPLFPDFTAAEDKLMSVIAKKFGFDFPLNEEVKKIDHDMLVYEWDNVMMGDSAECWDFNTSRNKFLEAFYSL